MPILEENEVLEISEDENVHTDFSDALNVDFQSNLRSKQELPDDVFLASEIVHVLSLFDPYGFWQLNLETQELFWSADVYKIYGMTPPDSVSTSSVNFEDAIAAYHPEDAKMLPQLIEDTAARQSGFRAVMRLKRKIGGYKLVKVTGMYRVRDENVKEIFGTFSEFQPANRSIAVI